MDSEQRKVILGNAIIKFAWSPFFTMKKLKFTYHVKGYEIFMTKKEMSIAKSSVNMDFQKAIELERIVIGRDNIVRYLFWSVINSKNLSDKVYEKIVKSLNRYIKDFDTEDISVTKMDILIHLSRVNI